MDGRESEVQYVLTYECEGCDGTHEIRFNDRIRVDIVSENRAFILGEYKGHDDFGIYVDTTLMIQLATFLGYERIPTVNMRNVMVLWYQVEEYEPINDLFEVDKFDA